MKNLIAIAFVLSILIMAMPASAQNTFSLTAQPIALPGGGQTVAAGITGMTFTPTPNFDLRQDTLLTTAGNLQGFFGGINYRLPILSTKLNNVSPQLNGLRFQFYLTGSVGVDRVDNKVGPVKQHYAFLGGGGFNYDFTGSGRWTFGAEVRYARLPGFANNTGIISAGPTLHW
jgi:hypothetical protein